MPTAVIVLYSQPIMRLLGVQIANGFSPEARVFASLLNHIDPALIEACVLYHQWSGDLSSASEFEQVAGVSVQRLDFGWRSLSANRSLAQKIHARLHFFRTLPHALTLARQVRPDLIYSCQQLWDCQAATYVARRLNKPQIIHLHYTVGPWLHKPILDRLLTCDHVLTISDFIREEALGHGVAPEKVTTLRNTINTPNPAHRDDRLSVRQEIGLALDTAIVGIAARLDPDKGQADALRAFAKITGRHPKAHLMIIGNETPWHPGYTNALKALASELAIDDRVSFLGYRCDVARLLRAIDVFIHPSRHEPFGLAVAEACAAGLPVVAYAEGGIKEIIEDEVTGLLALPGDITELSNSLSTLLSDRNKAQKMGYRAQEKMVREFQPQDAGHRFAGLLNDIAFSRNNIHS